MVLAVAALSTGVAHKDLASLSNVVEHVEKVRHGEHSKLEFNGLE
jgi:hypothetical protein